MKSVKPKTSTQAKTLPRRVIAAGSSGLLLLSASNCLASAIDAPTSGGAPASAEAQARPAAFQPRGVWISCDDGQKVAYRVVPPALNPHAAFTHPIKVKLKASESCQDLK